MSPSLSIISPLKAESTTTLIPPPPISADSNGQETQVRRFKSRRSRSDYEKLYQWIWKQEEGGSRVATVDVVNYIQNELDYCGEEPSMSPRAPLQNQQPQPMMPVTSSGFPVTSGSSGQTIAGAGQGLRSDYCENQPKNSVFSNALSSPVRRNLQLYQIGEGGNRSFLHNQSSESNAVSSNNDSAMDMHAD
ncbi:holocarboxylase synthetase [Medicago truncatula]|uniref:Holocarboxylase synthetase n=1 Tax=Medicago truncatula TaxID=3880 RepID=A0A072U9G7_MEDTR|nr:holocarboxylase synthetase [Medicago truncatula]